jgi:glycosyltransferase involved in cell wall biosynthesis
VRVAFPLIRAGSGNDAYFDRLAACLEPEGIAADIIEFGYRLEFANLLFGPAARKRLRDYDLVHCAADYGSIFQAPGKPLVLTFHHNVFEADYQRQTSILQKMYHHGLLRRRLSRGGERASAAVYVSRHGQQCFAALLGGNLPRQELIYNAVDTDFFEPPDRRTAGEPLRLVYVGSMSRRKGTNVLESVMSGLGQGFRLTCITRSSDGFPVGPNIEVRQQVDDAELLSCYRSADLMLFPTRLEGFGYVVAEAMACGLPVVSSRSSAIPELVIEGKGGYLCEPGDVAGYIGAVRRLAESAQLRSDMGRWNRERVVREFSMSGWARRYAELYRDLCGPRI